MTNNRIIVALDMADDERAFNLVQQLDPTQCRVKIGKELFTRYGPDFVERVQNAGFEVFLDLKFHDIPNTVANAVSAACELGVWMITLHAAGGSAMMRAAREAADKHTHKPLLVAVTVLTSLSDEDLTALGIARNTAEQVQRLSSLAQGCGMDGVVCSAAEAANLRRLLSEDFVLVTPGIRPAGDLADDQKRVVTPIDALKAGSNYLVIGRPITRYSHPLEKLQAIQREISAA